jgi:2-polyprenyl-3-methyl-5-hydroxy-6-metoxy-1,4-benzoquinol methylase
MWTDLLLKSDTERKIIQYAPRVEKIVSSIKDQGRRSGGVALDLGAGSGAFSVCLKSTGFFNEVIALDLSEDCVTACTNRDLKTLKGTITDLDDGSIDLICMNDLIEHLFDPFSFLKECYRVLRDSGYISIATPNGEGFDFKILKDKTKNITPPEHLTYFNPYSLSLLLSKTRFSTVFVETPGKLDIEIILKEKKSGYPIRDENEYIDYLLEQDEEVLQNFQKFLSENRLSSHMLIMAQKI